MDSRRIRKSIKIKNALFISGDMEKYKLYRNKLLSLIRLYYHTYSEENLDNMIKTWEGINQLIGPKKKSSKLLTALKRPNNKDLTQNPYELTDILNRNYTSVGRKLLKDVPSSDRHFSEYLGNDAYPNSFFFDPVTSLEIESEIMLTSLNKAYGLYSCPIRILKGAKHIISATLAEVINMSVQSGVYSSKLKHAKVIPVYKTGDETEPGNYRPIPLLSVFNRLFERLMKKRLTLLIEKNQNLSQSQYGFRKNHSTQHAILDIVNTIQSNMDAGLFSCGVFIDLKKAFDTVDHSILLCKLHHYGVRGIINDWFLSYLSDRIQTTQIGASISSKRKIIYGVSQGSILGPLLFLIYINDIYLASYKLSFHLFADDTNLLYADENLKSLEADVNDELMKVCEWLNANKLSLNNGKSNFVIFHPYQHKAYYDVNLKIYDNSLQKSIPLERKNYVKYLGVLIDSNLSWRYRIDHISSKISKGVGIIAKLRHFVPTNTLTRIYRSLIEPYISYGLTAWGQAANCLLIKVLILQKRALRLIYFSDCRAHAIPLFLSSSILPLHLLLFKYIAILMRRW